MANTKKLGNKIVEQKIQKAKSNQKTATAEAKSRYIAVLNNDAGPNYATRAYNKKNSADKTAGRAQNIETRMKKSAAPKMPKGESPKKLSPAAANLKKLSGASGSASAASSAKIRTKTQTTPKGWGSADWHGNVWGQELNKLKKK